MSDDALNPNFEWKKKSFGKKERLSRRIDARQATLSEKKQKNNFSAAVSLKDSSQPIALKANLKKMRKTIKQALDDDEDENEEFYIEDASLLSLENELNDVALFKSLNDREKKILQQKQTLRDIKMQQAASKVAALSHVNRMAKKTGLAKLSAQNIAQNMQNNGWGKETLKMAIEHNISPDIKTSRAQLTPEKITKLMKGIKRLQKIGGISAVQGMKINEVIHITDTRFDDKKVAQLLLKKTGRSPNKRSDKIFTKTQHLESKISFKKLLKQRQENTLMKA